MKQYTKPLSTAIGYTPGNFLATSINKDKRTNDVWAPKHNGGWDSKEWSD